MKRVCVFCGSRDGADGVYAEAAVALGRELAARGVGLVFGGGRVGLMGRLADAVLQAGGEVQGVIPRGLAERELAHEGLTRLHVVESMHERKSLMAELSDGFIALPGGMGTLEEIAEIVTWAQLGIHADPCGLLNVRGYWDGLLGTLEHFVTEGFLEPAYRSLWLVGETPAAVLDSMERWQPLPVRRWLDAGQT